jgi:hypothetical protein
MTPLKITLNSYKITEGEICLIFEIDYCVNVQGFECASSASDDIDASYLLNNLVSLH